MKLLILLLIVAGGVYAYTQRNLRSVGVEQNVGDGTEPTFDPGGIADILDEARAVTGVEKSVEIYDGIAVAKTTTTVDLSGRGLSGALKAEIRLVSSLTTLDISSNNFTGLPAEIGQLLNLEVLDLSDNPLTGLPLELGNLQNLQQLNLRGTNYTRADLEQIRAKLPFSTEILVD
jgi:Leucine-rich repeat (LRR) protein